MSEYSGILQIICYIILLVILYYLIHLFRSVWRAKRLENYAIHSKDNNFNFEYKLWKGIHRVSVWLSKIVFLDDIAKNYERFIKNDEKNYKSPMDFVTIKIFSCIFFILLYIFEVLLHGLNFNVLILLVITCFGFLLPDFVYNCEDCRVQKSMDSDIIGAIIIMNNSFKANMSIRQAIDNVIRSIDGPVKEEFVKVKDDINHGFMYGEAFYNMYLRTDSNLILKITNIMKLVNKSGYSLINSFDSLEIEVVKERKELNDLKMYENTNNVFRIIVAILPVILFILAVLMNRDYLNLIFASKIGYIVVIIELLIYIIYLCVIEIVRR